MIKSALVALLFFLCGCALLASLMFVQQGQQQERILLETSTTAEQIALRVQACFESRARIVNTLAHLDWQDRAQLEREWQGRAANLLPLQDGVQALNYVDPQRYIRVVYPLDGNAAALNADLKLNPNPSVIRALDEAESSGLTTRTDALQLLQGGSGVTIYHAINGPDGSLLGFANGVFRLPVLMESCLSEAALRDRFNFQLAETDGRVFYHQGAAADSWPLQFQVTRQLKVLGHTWQLDFVPSRSLLARQNSPLDWLWLVLGLLLVCGLAALLYVLLNKQRSLARSQAQYRLLVENQRDMLVQVDAQGRLVYVSPSYCRLFGQSEESLLGSHFMPLVQAEDQQQTQLSLELVKHPPYQSYHEQRARTQEGWRWLAWSNNAVLNEQGEVTAITAVGRDITELKSLETRVAQAQKMQALGQMAGGIAHDFNNLLQVMIGNIELLSIEHGDNPELSGKLQRVQYAIESAMALTARLATLSRDEPSHRSEVNLKVFLKDLLGLLERTLPASLNIDLHMPEEEVLVEANRSQLEQVLLNICFNARDAIEGPGRIEIILSCCELPQGYTGTGGKLGSGCVCIEVADNGSGIPADILDRIFDPFFTTKDKGRGTGLGLANCYSIIQEHGGEIHVDSEPGAGTSFRIYLPTARLKKTR